MVYYIKWATERTLKRERLTLIDDGISILTTAFLVYIRQCSWVSLFYKEVWWQLKDNNKIRRAKLAAEKKTPFLVQLIQIFGPSYFVRALDHWDWSRHQDREQGRKWLPKTGGGAATPSILPKTGGAIAHPAYPSLTPLSSLMRLYLNYQVDFLGSGTLKTIIFSGCGPYFF